MKKSIPALFSILALGALSFFFWPGEDLKDSPDQGTSSKTPKKNRRVALKGSESSQEPQKSVGVKKTTVPQKKTEASSDRREKAPRTRVTFKTFLPNGKPYSMSVQVEQNGKTMGGTSILGLKETYELEAGEATALCAIGELINTIGKGRSDPVTFLVTGKKEQIVSLTLKDDPGLYLEVQRSRPSKNWILFDLIYDKDGSLTEKDVRERAKLRRMDSSKIEIQLSIKPGVYHFVASTYPYRIELIRRIEVNRFETRSYKLPAPLTDDQWRFIKVTDGDGLPVTEAQFRFCFEYAHSDFQYEPLTKHLGEGLYKVNVPLSKQLSPGLQSSTVITRVQNKNAAVTPFNLSQSHIDVSLKHKGTLRVSLELKGRKGQNALIEVDGSGTDTDFRYPEKTSLPDLLPGPHKIKVYLKQTEAYPLQGRLIWVLVYQGSVDIRPGENAVPITIENYDRTIDTKVPGRLAVVFRKNYPRDHPWLAKTDVDGRAQLENLVPGDYTLSLKGTKTTISFTVP